MCAGSLRKKEKLPDTRPLRVVSGGQTGVDRAALDVALALGLSCGGWCPEGRLAEDGPLPLRYPLKETPSPDYEQRTGWNVRDSDGTLVLYRGSISGGTAFTVHTARRLIRPCLSVDVREADPVNRIISWLENEQIRVLNVAGPRESGEPGIYLAARALLREVFQRLLE